MGNPDKGMIRYEIRRQQHKRRRRLVAMFAGMVVIIAALALMLPALSLTHDEATPEAGFFGAGGQQVQAGGVDDATMRTFEGKLEGEDGATVLLVTAEAPENALPEGAQMRVAPVTDSQVVEVAKEEAQSSADIDAAKSKVLAADISFVDALGNEVEPGEGVLVKISAPEVSEITDQGSLAVVHVADDLQAKAIASDEVTLDSSNEEIAFEASEFSVYAVVYTVDFHWEINGNTYDFSIPGGGFVSLEHLVEVLGIASADQNSESGAGNAENGAENGAANEQAVKLNEVEVGEAAKKFVADVEKIEFSNPELVWVGKVDDATTVGGIKESQGIEAEFSTELTEEQIAEINAQELEAGDWALISMHPFTSEESLAVTMKDGDQFVVKVTDAQISTHVITANGEDFLITVTYGPEAVIPNGAELIAKELLPGTDGYEAHYAQMIAAVEGETSDSDLDDEMYAAFSEVGLEVVDPTPKTDVAFARFFDISIWKDDVEVEPLVPVQVEIQYIDPVRVDFDTVAEVVHFADDCVELIDPETGLDESSGEGISSFTFQQSSFSISATLLKYTTGIPDGNYVIIKGAKVNNQDHYYALKADGSTVEVTKNGDTFTNTSSNADDAFWSFTNAGNGKYYIQNRSNWRNRLVLYNSIVGNWDQEIVVEASSGRKTVYLRNPNNTPLRFNGNTRQFVLGAQNDNADQFYLARMTSEIPKGQGYDLTPAAETNLGDLNAWKDKVENSKIIVDKTASVVDYDNRIYQIDLKALSDITIISNKVDLELIVDTSRSMYFPANLSPLSGYYFTSIMGNDSHSLEKQLSLLDKNQIYYFIGNGEQATVYALYYAASRTNLNDYSDDRCWKYVDASYMNPPDASSMNQTDRLNKLVGMRIDDLAYGVCNQNRNGGGCRLYTASSSITRLAYLKEAHQRRNRGYGRITVIT